MLNYYAAHKWAQENFNLFTGRKYKADHIYEECIRLFDLYPGKETKRVLFIWAPSSYTQLFSLDDKLTQIILGSKLAHLANFGGMIFGAQFNGDKAHFTPLLVVNP